MFIEKEEIDFEEFNELDDKTVRDTKGFGSTSLKLYLISFS